MPDLDDIRTFVEIVETGSLTRAGGRLDLSKSVVSRRLARLEAELGMPLVARSTRGLSLTEAGSDFRPYAERMVAEMQSARDALSRQGEATGRLRLSAPLSFGNTHLAPVIVELALRNPRLAIDTGYSDRHVDLVGEGYDAAVRLGTLSEFEPDRAADRAGAGAAGCEPGLSGPRRGAADARGPGGARDDPASGPDVALRARRPAVDFRPRGRFTTDSGEAELAAVVAGLGVSVMPDFLAGPAIGRGELVTLLDAWEIPAAGLYVVRPPPAEPMPMKVRVLIELMVATFGGRWDPCAGVRPRPERRKGGGKVGPGLKRRRARRPGALSPSSIVAPCMRATAATRARPRPAPGPPRLGSSRTKRPRARARSVSGMPGPRSPTTRAGAPASARAATVIAVPAGACFRALSTRFETARARSWSWPWTTRPGAASQAIERPRSSAAAS